jgi:hypothetical protein
MKMPQVENGRITETATEARGAVLGLPVLYVLIVGIAAVIAVFTVVYTYFLA